MAWVATAIVGSGVVGALATGYAANKASEAQQNAAQTAANTQLNMFNQTNANLAPFRNIGVNAGNQLQTQLSDLTTPIAIPTMDQATLEKTPGYQFNLTQGLKSTQNSAAARGLGSSGAALKGAATFASGLAANTYGQQFGIAQQQFQDAVTNQTNAYNRLFNLVNTGENAAAQTGQAATATGQGVAQTQIGAGNAAAAGINATGGAISNLANNIGGYAAYKGLYGNGSGAGQNWGTQAVGNYQMPVATP